MLFVLLPPKPGRRRATELSQRLPSDIALHSLPTRARYHPALARLQPLLSPRWLSSCFLSSLLHSGVHLVASCALSKSANSQRTGLTPVFFPLLFLNRTVLRTVALDSQTLPQHKQY